MALNFSIFLCPPEPLLQYPCVRAQLELGGPLTFFDSEWNKPRGHITYNEVHKRTSEKQQQMRGFQRRPPGPSPPPTAKTVRNKDSLLTRLHWDLPISERVEKSQTIFGSAFSHMVLHCCLGSKYLLWRLPKR